MTKILKMYFVFISVQPFLIYSCLPKNLNDYVLDKLLAHKPVNKTSNIGKCVLGKKANSRVSVRNSKSLAKYAFL